MRSPKQIHLGRRGDRSRFMGLLLAYVLRQEGGWFLAAAALTGFTILVTVILVLVLKPDGAALKR